MFYKYLRILMSYRKVGETIDEEEEVSDEAVILGEYVTFKHVKTRKVVVLEVEVPEEYFQDVITKLGMPIGGESKPVAVALLNDPTVKENLTVAPTIEKTEGERIRERACILCKEEKFHEYVESTGFLYAGINEVCVQYIYMQCNIASRSDLTRDKTAQALFKRLDARYKAWLNPVDEQYTDNIKRMD